MNNPQGLGPHASRLHPPAMSRSHDLLAHAALMHGSAVQDGIARSSAQPQRTHAVYPPFRL